MWWKLGLEKTSVWELTLGPWLSHKAKSFQAADAAGNKMFLALAVCGHHPRSSKVHRCLGLTPRFWYNFLGIWILSFPDDFDVQLNWEPLLAASHSEVIPTCRERLALKSLQGAEQNPNTAIPAEHAAILHLQFWEEAGWGTQDGGQGALQICQAGWRISIEPLAQNTLDVTGVELLLSLIPYKVISGLCR